jgi:hypothetical protein
VADSFCEATIGVLLNRQAFIADYLGFTIRPLPHRSGIRPYPTATTRTKV